MTDDMSQTLLAFAQPVLVCAPPHAPAAEVHHVLSSLAAVWNAVLMVEAGVPGVDLAALRHGARTYGPPGLAAEFDYFITRKRTHFAHERRYIGRITVRRAPDGRLCIRARARATPPPEAFR